MKDQYVGDLNDFAKYQLLRICAVLFDQITVAWMLTKNDGRTDGGRTGYLQQRGFRDADPELFDQLRTLVARGERNVAAVQTAKFLPGCSFEPEPVPLSHVDRSAYFERLARQAAEDTLIFFDPDNGLEVASVAKHRRGAEKFLFWDEVQMIRDTGASVMIYQHFPRVDRVTYSEASLARLKAEMGSHYHTYAVRTSHVAFLFAIRSPYAKPLRSLLESRCKASDMLSLIESP